ncbi:hypothetical protein [Shinella sumterensis]|uniref:hypothetical protein n=1 Tax=Shinella sumterensis TaxID=1967501 RepID=UPI00106E1E2D|nr:hypothetical protein [Shinella sumterensis]MCD1264068.1 hypothetical protein [Shinella sumterensis]
MPVSARFHELRDKVLAAVDDKFAEPVRLSFLKSGVVDPTRPAVEIEAVLRVGEGKTTSVAGSRDSGWRSRIVADKAQLHIDRTTYTGPQPKQGDKVKALSRWGEPWFEVADVDDRSHTRLVLNLNEA